MFRCQNARSYDELIHFTVLTSVKFMSYNNSYSLYMFDKKPRVFSKKIKINLQTCQGQKIYLNLSNRH